MDSSSSSLRKPVSTAVLKQPAIVVNRLTPDVMKNKTEWLISEDYSILQVIQDQQSVPSSQKIPKPAHIPNWDMAADAVNSVSRVYRSASCCKSQLENVILLREGEISYDNNTKKTKGIYKTKNNRPMKTSHLYQQDNNGTYTSIFLKRSKAMFKLAQKRKALAESVKNKKKILKIPKGQSYLNDYGIKYNNPRTPMEIANSCQERIQRKQQKNQTVGTKNNRPMKTSHLYQQDNNGTYTSIFLKRSKAMFKLAQKRKALAESVKNKKKILKIPKGQSYLNDYGIKYNNPRTPMEIANSCQERIQRKQQKNQTVGTQSIQSVVAAAQVPAQTVVQVVVTATPSLPGMLHTPTTLPSTMLTTSNVLKGTPAVAVGQQQTAAILQQMATSSARISGQHAVTLAVPAIVTQAQEQQVMIQTQSIQSVVAAAQVPAQTVVQVVTATPSLPGMLHTPTTLPSTMLTTSNVLKGTPAVAVGQQQTAAIPQQMATSSARISGQHAVTLAVPAIVTQAQEQQVMIQVQPSAHFFLVTPQAQVTMLQMQIQQLSQNASTTNIDPPVAVQQQKVSPYTMRFYNQQK